MLIKKAFAEIKAGPDDGLADGQFTGYASVFGNKDSYGDVVMPGAFTKDLAQWAAKGDPIPVLFGHNMSDPDYNIGWCLDAKEDTKGLLVKVQLDLENLKSMQTYRLLKGRRINQMSFAYDVVSGGWATRPIEGAADGVSEEYYELRELKLYEVSVVPVGANQETEILDVKSLRRFADHVDLKAGRVLSAKNETELRDAHDAIGRVLSALDSTSDEEKASGNGPSQKESEASDSVEASQNPSVDPSALEMLELEIELGV